RLDRNSTHCGHDSGRPPPVVLGSCGWWCCWSRQRRGAVLQQARSRAWEAAMKKLAGAIVALAVVLVPNMALAASWTSSVNFTNQVASTPFRAGGYPVPAGPTG